MTDWHADDGAGDTQKDNLLTEKNWFIFLWTANSVLIILFHIQ